MMEIEKKKIGQLTEAEFLTTYGKVTINETGIFTTKRGNTVNYWIRHEDGSFTNYDCKTVY